MLYNEEFLRKRSREGVRQEEWAGSVVQRSRKALGTVQVAVATRYTFIHHVTIMFTQNFLAKRNPGRPVLIKFIFAFLAQSIIYQENHDYNYHTADQPRADLCH